jgi:hypothetical protein
MIGSNLHHNIIDRPKTRVNSRPRFLLSPQQFIASLLQEAFRTRNRKIRRLAAAPFETMLRHRNGNGNGNSSSRTRDDNDSTNDAPTSRDNDVPSFLLVEALSVAASAAPRTMMRVAFADEVREETSASDAREIRKPSSMVSSVPSSFLRIHPASLIGGGNSVVPAPVPVTAEDEDLQSLGSYASLSTSPHKTALKWSARYTPPPVVSQSALLTIGLVCFVLAYVWPPLILLLAYVSSKLIPYSYRLNDDASYRRRLYKEFASQEDSHPAHFYSPTDGITIDESFWVNDRYVLRASCARGGMTDLFIFAGGLTIHVR